MSLLRKPDGSFCDEAGRYVFLSKDAFIERIVRDECCFVCAREIVERTEEHIIPDWIVRDCGLAGQKIKLPNGALISYARYKLPCCRSCNEALGEFYETPISKAFRSGFAAIEAMLVEQPQKLFCWLNLLHLKTHLKDLRYRYHLNPKNGLNSIGSLYDWEGFHHCHAVACAPIFRTDISDDIVGSMCLINLAEGIESGPFDYRDHDVSDSIYIRIGDIAIIAILNDSCAVISMLEGRIQFSGKPNLVQAMEILTEWQTASLHLKNRPKFFTRINKDIGKCEIDAFIPPKKIVSEYSPELRGNLMLFNLQEFLHWTDPEGVPLSERKDEILSGALSFLNPST